MRLSVVALTVFLVLASANLANSQQGIILDSDSARLFEGLGQYFSTPGQPETLPGTGQVPGGTAVFKILKVSNVRGNNPFNPLQPVFNFGGILVSNVDDLINCVRAGVCIKSSKTGSASEKTKTTTDTSQTIACSPNTAVSDKASFKDSVGCYIKDGGITCRVGRLNEVGTMLEESLFVMYDNMSAMGIVAGTDKTSSFTMVSPPPGTPITWMSGTTVYKISPGTYTTIVQHKSTGVKFHINFTVANLPAFNVRLTVNSIKKTQQ